ncbi:MAG: hypothetical protein ACU0B9_11335 [Limimaricola soesokkakensis]|uniref:hypothetical protein n=1 Tax=Limimaricola soesokkakensis TaxID=1343159 RepID=UPI00405A0A19
MLQPVTRTLIALPLAAALLWSSALTASAQPIPETELAALRYFLSVGDAPGIEAEKTRLQGAFPQASIDALLEELVVRSEEVDTSQIWQLIAADDFEGARGLIERTRQGQPGWTPPENLLAVLNEREGQSRFESAVETGELQTLMAVLNDFPDLLTCQKINNAWRLAELQTAQALPHQAVMTYDGILASCQTPDFVVATLQKAAGVADKTEMAALFERARTLNPGLGLRLASLEAELAPLIGKPVALPGASQLAVLAVETRPQPRGIPPVVQQVSAPAPAPAPVVRSAVPQPVRATKAAPAPQAAPSGGGDLAAAQAAAARKDWATCLKHAARSNSIASTSQRGWCALELGRSLEAISAFRHSAANAGNAQLRQDSDYGLILAYLKADMVREAAAHASHAKLNAQQKMTTDRQILSRLALSAFERKSYGEAITYVDRLSREAGGLDRGMAMLRGYSFLHMNRKAEARKQFAAIHRVTPSKDTQEAMALVR